MATILCVEDEAEIRAIVADELRDAGHDVLQVANGAEGLEAIHRECPDLVICDCLMPVMSGVQMFERLRTLHPEHKSMPFLFLSAYADKSYVEGVLGLGANGYLTKPVDLGLLMETVNALLAGAAVRDEGRRAAKVETVDHG